MYTLYLECFSGISGDMMVAALLDLGADEKKLRDALGSLGVGGYRLNIGRTLKCGISACDFDVQLDEHAHHSHADEHEEEHEHHAHTCEHAHEGGHTHHHSHPCEHEHHTHACEHKHEQEHEHEHEHEHKHAHEHRGLAEITAIIDRSGIAPRAKETAKIIFARVARAEAAVHGLPLDEVHFHEVGAIDSIVDIVGVAVCLDDLEIGRVYCSSLYEGQGTVTCQHGIMPVPAPATAQIIADSGLSMRLTENRGEMVTPTGAAIAAALCTHSGPPLGDFCILKTGYGAGKKDFERANVLRAHLIRVQELVPPPPSNAKAPSRVGKLECNLDNMTGEQLGFAMERLLEAGALDVWFTPIQMKKCRPAVLLSVLCSVADIPAMEDLIFLHTGTLGVRRCMYERTVMHREQAIVETPYGAIEVKRAIRGELEKVSAEYESARKTAMENDLPLCEVYRVAEENL